MYIYIEKETSACRKDKGTLPSMAELAVMALCWRSSAAAADGSTLALRLEEMRTPGSTVRSSSSRAMLHWRSVPFLVHDHTESASRTMARMAVLCAFTDRNSWSRSPSSDHNLKFPSVAGRNSRKSAFY